MIALLQRVSEARVVVAGDTVGQIGPGLLMLVCAEPSDGEVQALRLVEKVLKLRILSGGNRPGFSGAAPAAQGRAQYEAVLRLSRERHPDVQSGVFGADMKLHLINDGPVTIPLRLS